jgi:hypothetical protein
MRAWLLLLLVSCAHRTAPVDTPSDPSAPSPAQPEDIAAAISAAEAVALPPAEQVTVVAFLCDDSSERACPPCPQGADCAACPPRAWLFCDTPGAIDFMHSLHVIEPAPTLRLTVGRRYLLLGPKAGPRELALRAIHSVD